MKVVATVTYLPLLQMQTYKYTSQEKKRLTIDFQLIIQNHCPNVNSEEMILHLKLHSTTD